MGIELSRQAIPVVINEVFVRGVYFVRRFYLEMKEKNSIDRIDWRKLIPGRNRTIVRMLTISTGILELIDLADASIRAVSQAGISPAALPNFILRVNFVGMGRFCMACSCDIMMGIRKGRLELALTSAEVGIAAVNTIHTMDEIEVMQAATEEHLEKITQEIEEVSSYRF